MPTTSGLSSNPGNSPAVAQIAPVPHAYGALAFHDIGPRPATQPVSVTLTLQYNHQAQLNQLVAQQADPSSPMYHQYLTSAQFDSYYAPTAAQEAQVVQALHAAGFTITHQYANRTLIEATAPTAAAESFFHTTIHTVTQGKYGQRYMNTQPGTLPKALTSLVQDVTMNNLVVAHTQVSGSNIRHSVARKLHLPGPPQRRMMAVQPFVTNVITNPHFGTGAVNDGWFQCGNINSHVVTAHPYIPPYDLRSGSTNGEPNGDTGVCQAVTIPQNGVLSLWLYQLSDEANTNYAWQEADLLDAYGDVVDNLYTTVNNYAGWVNQTFDLSAYAGGTYYLYIGVHGDGYPYLYTEQFVGDVSLTNGSPSTPPPPTPAPTATPAPTPAPTATPAPTPAPTATPAPTPAPTATPAPTPAPTATPAPTPAPTATPAPTPAPTATPSGNCTGTADNGPLNGANGWLATGVAKAFDYPVQHGCNGAGQTVAVEIDTPINQSDVNGYLNAAGVTQTGTVTNEAVNGGGSASSSDYIETALDVETISGLAPGANIIVYNFPNLSSQNIEAGYNQAVSDGIASVVNSSFGGCETSDTAFDSTTNSIAQQAAAKGITFSASSGDSGSDECGTGNNPPEVSSPATDPYFTAVGAVNFTDSSTTGALTSITAGVDSSNGFSSGGGVSTIFSLPSYQQGVANINTSGRNDPDISLPGVGVMVYANGTQQEVDGTSWASPEFCAFMAEANEVHNTHFGFVNPTLYSVFQNTGYTDFTDVTTGSNGAYSAGPGYDLVTGIGAPKGWALANAL
ncbi:MAG: protease pro-enzyme activation domain-containing protein [Vulcanimicrobiaceae bacterium]